MFTAITEKNKLTQLQHKFKKSLDHFDVIKCDVRIGHVGDSWEDTVLYSAELNMWWLLGLSGDKKRYWNAFGIGKPEYNVNIIVELNYSIEGVNRRVAGNWAVDDDGRYCLFHSGAITIGKTGEGRSRFKSMYLGEFYDLDLEGKHREAALVARLDEENFAWQIKDFVEQVGRIKNNQPISLPGAIHKFGNEFDESTHFYRLPQKVKKDGNHGLVVNALYKQFQSMGLLAGNNGKTGRIDLFLFNKKGIITQVFEAKTALSIQNVCTAIGQLLLYSYPLALKPRLTFVCPNGVPPKIKSLLDSLQITILHFDISSGTPSFIDLNRIIA